jgi:hypothetical protein
VGWGLSPHGAETRGSCLSIPFTTSGTGFHPSQDARLSIRPEHRTAAALLVSRSSLPLGAAAAAEWSRSPHAPPRAGKSIPGGPRAVAPACAEPGDGPDLRAPVPRRTAGRMFCSRHPLRTREAPSRSRNCLLPGMARDNCKLHKQLQPGHDALASWHGVCFTPSYGDPVPGDTVPTGRRSNSPLPSRFVQRAVRNRQHRR